MSNGINERARLFPLPSSQANKVRTRPVEMTDKETAAVDAFWQILKPICGTPERTVAVLTFALSEFLLRVAKPETMPAAVETAVECLRINTGLAVPLARSLGAAERQPSPGPGFPPSLPPAGDWPRSEPQPPRGAKPR